MTGTALVGLFRWAFGWYAGLIRDVTFVYGAAGGVALFILWLYYSALVLFSGAAVGWAVERRLGIPASGHAPEFR